MNGKGIMSKPFSKLVAAEIKAGRVHELLTCGGDYNVTPEEAIGHDWQHALLVAQADAAEHLRFLSSEQGDDHRRYLRKDLARLAAVCELMAGNLEDLQ